MKHVFSISFEILGSHAQITEMEFTRAIGRTRVYLLTELPVVQSKCERKKKIPTSFIRRNITYPLSLVCSVQTLDQALV